MTTAAGDAERERRGAGRLLKVPCLAECNTAIGSEAERSSVSHRTAFAWGMDCNDRRLARMVSLSACKDVLSLRAASALVSWASTFS